MTTFGVVAKRGGGWLPLIGTAALAGALGTLALPAVLGHAVDAIVAGERTSQWLALAGGLIVLGVVADLVQAFAETACTAGTAAWLRNSLVRHVFTIGVANSRRFDSGDLVSRVSSNAVDAASAGPSVVTVGAAVLPPAGSLVLLAIIDPWLAVAFLAGIALVAVVLRAFTQQTAAVIGAYQQTQGQLAARLAESLAGARTIAAAGTVEQEQRRVLELLPELRDRGMQTWRVLARSTAQAAVAGPLVLVAVLAVGGVELAAGRISPGGLFAASQYAVLGAGLGGLTGVFGRLARARAGVRRAAEVLAAAPVTYGRRELPPGPGRLELRSVTARAGDTVLLADLDLVLPGGAAVAVVGPSGAGKSVLAALAARLWEPARGQVLLDGVPLGELSHATLHRSVACAFERPVLVGGTVADAIGLGRPRDQVQAAARASHAHEFISRLPLGYDTPLADAPMSGGEAQRVGLARAWDAERLLVLDDATSSLDMVTEMQISRTLLDDEADHAGEGGGGVDGGDGVDGVAAIDRRPPRRRTRLIVTHRVTTAARADLVVWLTDGRLRAVGPHDQLWDDPAYRAVFA